MSIRGTWQQDSLNFFHTSWTSTINTTDFNTTFTTLHPIGQNKASHKVAASLLGKISTYMHISSKFSFLLTFRNLLQAFFDKSSHAYEFLRAARALPGISNSSDTFCTYISSTHKQDLPTSIPCQ